MATKKEDTKKKPVRKRRETKLQKEKRLAKTHAAQQREVKARQEKFLSIFSKRLCNVAKTCKAVGISRTTYYDWLNTSNSFKEGVHICKEELHDDVETILHTKIFQEKNTASVIFFAKTQMQHRGYIETQNQNVTADISAKVKMTAEKLTDEELDAAIAEAERQTKLPDHLKSSKT